MSIITIDPARLVPPVPSSVTMRQARIALLNAGLLSQVDAAIESLPEPQKSRVRIEWEYSNTVERNGTIIPSLAHAMGLDDEQIDGLFVEAEKL